MKQIIFISLLCVCLQSCIDLDTKSTAAIGSAQMWTTEDLADAGVAGIYKVFYPNSETTTVPGKMEAIGRFRVEAISFTSNAQHEPYLKNMSPSASDEFFANEWKAAYEGIYRCNDAIANLHKAAISETKYKRLIAECKFLRAYFYYWLNALFQGVPIYLEPFVTTECTKTQNTVDEVWQAVLDDLDDCIAEENLPNNTLKENYGRPSKGSAYALRGIVYVWKKDYKKAIADFEQVGKCGYGLWEGEYIDFFKKENERDKEMIFPIQFDAVIGYSDCIQAIFGCRSTLQAVTFIQPNVDFVDSYQNADGSPFKWTDVFPDWDKLTPAQREIFFVRDGMNTNTNTDFQNAKKAVIGRVSQAIWDKYYLNEGNEARILTAYSTRDPRLMQTIFAPSTTTLCYANTGGKQSAKTVRWPFLIAGNGDAAGDHWPDARYYCNYTYRKFVVTNDSKLNRIICDEDWPLIRYTNIWLLYAEALNEDGRLGDAISAVNKIRERAHMPLLTDGGSGYNAVMGKEDMRKRIQYERRVELCAEGINFLDEVRWGTYKETKFQGKESNGFKNMWGTVGHGMWYWNDYLWPWPVPMAEVQRNPNLVPTPGWLY